jgi:hypothetical protein
MCYFVSFFYFILLWRKPLDVLLSCNQLENNWWSRSFVPFFDFLNSILGASIRGIYSPRSTRSMWEVFKITWEDDLVLVNVQAGLRIPLAAKLKEKKKLGTFIR